MQTVINGVSVHSALELSSYMPALAVGIYNYMAQRGLTEAYCADLARNETGLFPPTLQGMSRRSQIQRLCERGVVVEGWRFKYETREAKHRYEKTQRVILERTSEAAALSTPAVVVPTEPAIAAPQTGLALTPADMVRFMQQFVQMGTPVAVMPSDPAGTTPPFAFPAPTLAMTVAPAETPAQPGKPNPYVPADRRRPAPLDEIDGEEYAYRLEILRDTFRAEFEDWKDWSSQLLKHAWSYEDEAKKRVAAGEVQVAEIKAALLKWREDALLARQVTLDMLKEQTARQLEALEQKVVLLEKRLDELDPDTLNRLMEG